jgi:ribosomal protein L40E
MSTGGTADGKAGDVGIIICGVCGSPNEDTATFCGVCGSYLEWEGERVARHPQRPAPPVPPPPVEKQSLVDRVKANLGLEGEHPPPSEGAAATTSAPEASPAEGSSTPGQQREAPPAEPPAAVEATRQPTAVKPGAEAPRRQRRVLPMDDQPLRPGDTICPVCGAGNVPTRMFCRRCGSELADAVVAPPPPWWRRVFRRSPRTSPAAGTRPRTGPRVHLPVRLLVTLVTVALLALVLRVAWPSLGQPVDAVRDRVVGTQRVEPTGLTASSASAGHGAGAVRDGNLATFWSPARRGDGVGQFVQATFDSPFRLVAVQVFNGASRDDAAYLRTARPADVAITITRADGSVDTRNVRLRDDPKQQDVRIGANDVTAVRLTVQSAFGASTKLPIALGEVAFLTRS